MNHNVLIIWIYTFLDSLARGIYETTVLSGFLFDITGGSNSKVGLAEGLQGICQAAFAIPAGVAIDKYGRSTVLKISGFGTALTMALLIAVLFLDDSYVEAHIFWFLTAGLMLIGAQRSFRFAGVDTIYADSVSRKDRTWWNNAKRMLLIAGTMIGPILGIIMFSITGDRWGFRELRIVLATGLGVRACASLILLFTDDSKSLGEESSAVVEIGGTKNVKYGHLVPYIITAGDFIKAFAAGMTIKFFPLFFKNEVNMTPLQVNVVNATTYFLLIFFTYLSGKVADRLGRIQTWLLFAVIGCTLLLLMAVLESQWENWRVIVPIYVFRTIFMRSCPGIRKSVLMDYVPKKSRGRWNAVNIRISLGSAVVGGMLIDQYGYGYTFFITAALQLAGYTILSPLLYIVPAKTGANEAEPTVSREKSYHCL